MGQANSSRMVSVVTAGWAILWFIVSLFFLVFIHEMGHFLTAKWRGVKVLEFGLGLPPRIWGKQRGETIYSINWIPLGGFCKMLGEEDPSEPGSLASKDPWSRLLVLSAGSLVMLIFPVILFSFIYMVPHDEVMDYEGVKVVEAVAGSPADFAGVEEDDRILSVNGVEIVRLEDLSEQVDANLGSEITVVVLRDGEQISLQMVPRVDPPEGEGPIGVTLTHAELIREQKWYPPWTAVAKGCQKTWDMIVAMKDGISALISHEIPFELGGPVAAGDVTVEIAERGTWEDLLFWAGVLSFNLGIVNLLPLPALDGGRIVFVLIEMAGRGRRVSPRTEGMIHLIGFFLLIAFILFVTFQDIERILSGESLLP